MLAQGDDVVPIPGTRRRAHLEENAGALEVRLTTAQVAEIGALMAGVVGARYGRPHVYGDSIPLEEAHP